MNATQKITFAAGALAITVIGSLLVTAPMAFAHQVAVTTQSQYEASRLQAAPSGHLASEDTGEHSALVASNRA